eukprot:gene11075-12243_t
MEGNKDLKIETVEMHTGGEPLRIITSGYPKITGKTILDKRRFVKENFDDLRNMLMFEPRGHFDQYGALIVEPDDDKADLAVLFMHNEGYSTMCGHAVIALGRFAIDYGYVKLSPSSLQQESHQQVNIQCPCGLVQANVEIKNQKTSAVSFISVPAFAFALDVEVKTERFGTVVIDISYGGAFYVLVSADKLGLNVETSDVRDLVDAADIITSAAKKQTKITHPEEEDLSFLYGTILTDGKDEYCQEPTSNLCIFADRQLDRSPTGSGVTARMALQYAKKQISLNVERKFTNAKVKSSFTAKVVKETKCGHFNAVNIQVGGHAYYTGKSTFTVEENDPLKNGFLLK